MEMRERNSPETWASMVNCRAVLGGGRPGWAVLPGWEEERKRWA